MKVGRPRRYRFQRRPESARQTEERTLEIEAVARLKRLDQTDRGGQCAEQPLHVFPAQQRDLRASCRQRRKETGKLNEVAKPLLVPDQDAAALQILAAPLCRLRNDGFWRRVRALPAAFEILEALPQHTFEEQRAGAIVTGVRVGGLMRQSLVEADEGLVDLAGFLQCDAKARQSFRIVRANPQGFVIGGDRFGQPIRFLQHIAAIEPDLGRERIHLHRAIEGRQRLLKAAKLLQSGAAHAKRLRMLRIVAKRFVAATERLIGAAPLQEYVGAIGQRRHETGPDFQGVGIGRKGVVEAAKFM